MRNLRIAVLGAGYIGLATARACHAAGAAVWAVRRRAQTSEAGVVFVAGDLASSDIPGLPGALDAIVLTVAPSSDTANYGQTYPVAARTAVALARATGARAVVYTSSTGVYGGHDGAWVDESTPRRGGGPGNAALVEAEDTLLGAGLDGVTVLRVAGIYGPGRFPIARLKAGMPVLQASDDVYTNHIHADDLAAICVRALQDDAPPGVYNASDDSEIRMGDWLDAVADRFALPRPPRIARAEAQGRISPAMLSFMNESRRLINDRLKHGLGYALAYPTVHDGLRAAQPAQELAQSAEGKR